MAPGRRVCSASPRNVYQRKLRSEQLRVENPRGQIKHAQQQIQNDLRRRQRNAVRVEHDQSGKHPKRDALEAARSQSESRDEQAIEQSQHEDQPLKDFRREPPPQQEDHGRNRIAGNINAKVTSESFQDDQLRCGRAGKPAGIEQVIEHHRDDARFGRQHNVQLHGHHALGSPCRSRPRSSQQPAPFFHHLRAKRTHASNSKARAAILSASQRRPMPS